MLDAIVAEILVFTTPYDNEGIGATPERDLLVADDPRSFADVVVRLLTDQAFSVQLAESACAFVQRHYSPESLFRKLEELYHKLVQRES